MGHIVRLEQQPERGRDAPWLKNILQEKNFCFIFYFSQNAGEVVTKPLCSEADLEKADVQISSCPQNYFFLAQSLN